MKLHEIEEIELINEYDEKQTPTDVGRKFVEYLKDMPESEALNKVAQEYGLGPRELQNYLIKHDLFGREDVE